MIICQANQWVKITINDLQTLAHFMTLNFVLLSTKKKTKHEKKLITANIHRLNITFDHLCELFVSFLITSIKRVMHTKYGNLW